MLFRSNKLKYASVLIDAYPVAVSQQDLDWSSDNYHKLNVTFAYTNWQEGTVIANLKNLGAQALGGLLGI